MATCDKCRIFPATKAVLVFEGLEMLTTILCTTCAEGWEEHEHVLVVGIELAEKVESFKNIVNQEIEERI